MDGDRDDDADHAGRRERMHRNTVDPGHRRIGQVGQCVRKSVDSSTPGCRTPEKVTTVSWGCIASAAAGLHRKASLGVARIQVLDHFQDAVGDL